MKNVVKKIILCVCITIICIFVIQKCIYADVVSNYYYGNNAEMQFTVSIIAAAIVVVFSIIILISIYYKKKNEQLTNDNKKTDANLEQLIENIEKENTENNKIDK